jgi:hypothetical protein
VRERERERRESVCARISKRRQGFGEGRRRGGGSGGGEIVRRLIGQEGGGCVGENQQEDKG